MFQINYNNHVKINLEGVLAFKTLERNQGERSKQKHGKMMRF
jgi:hypothetical protein